MAVVPSGKGEGVKNSGGGFRLQQERQREGEREGGTQQADRPGAKSGSTPT